jgi:hypothetical protein
MFEPENGDTTILRNPTVYQSTLLSIRKGFEVDKELLLQFVVILESPLRVLSVLRHSAPP